MNLISSKDNNTIKQLKRLLDKPKRNDAYMVLEGIHLVQACLESGVQAERIWVAQEALANLEIQNLLERQHQNIYILPNILFRSLSTLMQGESILCEIRKPVIQPASEFANTILLDGIQDAGNLGSILRSAAAAGVVDVYLNDSCVNPFSPKVLRAGVGAHFSLNIMDDVDLSYIIGQLGIPVLATALSAQQSIYQTNLNNKVAWLFGSEGAGVSDELMSLSTAQVIIPMAAGESLNVAAAAAVCLFEMMRQQTY